MMKSLLVRSSFVLGVLGCLAGLGLFSACAPGVNSATTWTKQGSLQLGGRCLRSTDYAGTQQDHFGAEVCASNACEHGSCVRNCAGPQDQNPMSGCQKTSSWAP